MRLEPLDIDHPAEARAELDILAEQLRSGGWTVEVAGLGEPTLSRFRESAGGAFVDVLNLVLDETERHALDVVLAAIFAWAVDRTRFRGRDGAHPVVVIYVGGDDVREESLPEPREPTSTTSELVDQLEEAAHSYLLSELPTDQAAEVASQRLAELAITVFNWRTRLIPAVPRKCHASLELTASDEAAEHHAALSALVAKIETGGDLIPHLSRAVRFAHDPKGRRDKDRLIADWGLHHLHLSHTIESDGFVERDDNLLIAAFTPKDAYLIGIYPHGSWALKELLAVLVHNWPDAGLVLKLAFLVGLENEPTDEERLQLREAGVATPMVSIDGEVWASAALGQTTAGTSPAATQRSNVLMHTLREWHEDLQAKLDAVDEAADKATGRVVRGAWEAEVLHGTLGLRRGDAFYGIISLD